jgi:hypothetical protein
MRRADPPSKESYRLCKNDNETEHEARAQQRAVDPLMNGRNKYNCAVVSISMIVIAYFNNLCQLVKKLLTKKEDTDMECHKTDVK